MNAIDRGCRVVMHYTLTLQDGFVVDTTGAEPLDFTVGDGTLEPGLERHLLGLGPGVTEEFAIQPGTVFPFPVKAAVQELERAAFAEGMPIEPGMVYEFNTPAGDVVPGRILRVEGGTVTVDFNHPLAGKPFTFQVEILSIGPGPDAGA
jgi:FKBP-type peptidyl-prolyl cis-trans isomerase SlpA